MPLAVVTGRDTLLVDSVSKKVRALEEIVPLLDTRGTVSMAPLRAEELVGTHRGAAAVVVARAVTALPSLVELAAPLLGSDGILVAMKGDLRESEVERGDAAGKLAAMSRAAVRRYTLPGGGEQRTVVTYRRQGEPKVALPRRVGLAQRSPLA